MAKKFRYQHIMSAVEGKLPTAEQLKDAEIAVNVFAGAEKLAVKNSNGEVVTFGTEAQMNAAVADAIAPLAVKSAVDEEINAAVAPLQDDIDTLEVKKANVEDVPSIEGLAKAEDVTAEIAAAVEPLAVKAEVTEEINAAATPLQEGIDNLQENKVDWTESTPGRKHIVLANHDSVLGTALDGTTYNVAMVSKWDVADFGSSHLHLNLNSKDGIATINDDKQIATVDEVNAVDAKVDALEIPSIEGLAVASEVTTEIAAAVEPLATKAEVNAVDAKVEAIDLTPYATKDELSEAAADAVAKVVAEAPEDLDTLKEVADYIASDKTKASEIETKLSDYDAVIPTLATKGEVEAVDAKVEAIDFEPYATKEEVAALDEKKVDWTVSEGERKHIVLKNHDSVLGTALDGTTYNLAMVSKWDVADFGSASLHLNLNSKDAVTINDDKEVATVDEVNAVEAKVDALVIPSIDGLAKAEDVTAEIAAAVAPLAVKAEVDTALETKADSDKVYTKEDVNHTLEGYVPVEQYNDLKARLDNLEIMMSVYNAEREAQMDEIISNMSSDNKELVIDTLMESIVVPETTVAYTITAPLTDNSTVELTSPKYMTLINTSKEPVSTTISHAYEEGETTAATTVYLVGDFNTLTLENISPSVKSGYDAATVKDVVITENNAKNLSLSLDFQDGATITNNSDKDITIYDKSNSEIALTIVAPNSTVTLSNGQFTTLNAEVSDNTLIIKKNVHIDNLNLTKGNAIVEVARPEEVAGVVENYTVADGYTLSHRIYHITNENSSKLGGVGEMILDEDITRTSSIVAPLAPAYDAVWNLNGHNITVEGTPKSGVYLNRYTSNLEVKGEGVIHCEGSYGLWNAATTGKIIINDGVTIEAQTHAVYAEKGVIEINGGTFKLTNWADAEKDANGNLRFLINCYDANYKNGTAKIVVTGGKFYDFDPANNVSEGEGTSYVPEGYESVVSTETIDGVEHRVYTVKKVS